MNKFVYADILRSSIERHATLPCLHIKRDNTYTTWTYQSFHHDCNRLSAVLKKHGLKKGTNAAVIGENSPEWIIAFHSIFLSQACTVPIDPNIPPEEIENILVTTKSKIVFCSKMYLELMRTIQKQHGFIQRIILLEQVSSGNEPTFRDYIASDNGEKDMFKQSFTPDDPIVILFTSGTTGKAKGVVVTQKNLSSVCNYAVQRMQLSSNDTVCAVLPLHHVFGCAASIIAPLSAGIDIVCVPAIKGPLILEALNDKQVTYLPAVPKLLQLFYDGILHNVKKKGPLVWCIFSLLNKLSATVGDTIGTSFRRALFPAVHQNFGGKLRLIISGGASLNKTYWIGFKNLGFTIVEGYGLSETFGPITVCPSTDPRLGSVGPVLPDNELRIDAPDSTGLGEVLLRGACIFNGYYQDPNRTHETLDDAGWFHSGDLGIIDRDGYLYLKGRKKDVIVLDSGKNVYPDELEDYYGTSPLIDELGVFGVSVGHKEIVAAVIVPEPSIRQTMPLDQAEIILANELLRLGQKMPVYRRINSFVISTTELPRTTTRKLKKNELRLLYASKQNARGRHSDTENSIADATIMESAEFSLLLDDICRIAIKTDRKTVTPRSNFIIDLGFDSLDRVELLTVIEKRIACEIPETVFDKIETVGDIIILLHDLKNNPTKRTLFTRNFKKRILENKFCKDTRHNPENSTL